MIAACYNRVMKIIRTKYFRLVHLTQLTNLSLPAGYFILPVTRGALHSLEDNTRIVSPVDGTFQHERATAYVLPNPSISYSSINTLCSNSKTPFKGLALTILRMCDMRTNEGEVSLKTCTLYSLAF